MQLTAPASFPVLASVLAVPSPGDSPSAGALSPVGCWTGLPGAASPFPEELWCCLSQIQQGVLERRAGRVLSAGWEVAQHRRDAGGIPEGVHEESRITAH